MMRAFLATEVACRIVVIAASALAMLAGNSALAPRYAELLHLKVGSLSLLHWMEDGLMALFFLIVGLDIKREVVEE